MLQYLLHAIFSPNSMNRNLCPEKLDED